MLKRSRIIAVISFVIVIAFSLPCYSESWGKAFYRSLSGRLGKNRADYPALSDSEFANFREVKTSGIAPGRLFRSSSPISTWSERNVIADKLAENAGVKTFINLADSDAGMKSHKGFPNSYYSRQRVIGLDLNMKYKSARFRQGLARGIRFMAGSEPPYLIHCSLGKDRAGFVCALIECLMGASWPEVERDYMASFRNYFGIVEGTREYDFVVKNEIRKFLAEHFGIDNPETANLPAYAERYFLAIGVSSADIESLKRKLGGSK
ncbi:MAG: tyrosine-protein phosphatase [Synergistaceae bacterium]|nr:tyrosine-protein phosphatase [Synergistaceae bacterium]